MVHIVNSSQQITHAVLAPASTHSRVVSCGVFLGPGPADGFAFTFPLGQVVRLLEINVWLGTKPLEPLQVSDFGLFRLRTVPKSFANIVKEENIMVPNAVPPRLFWTNVGSIGHFRWLMNVLYEGSGQRFGVSLIGNPATNFFVQVSFKISEG